MRRDASVVGEHTWAVAQPARVPDSCRVAARAAEQTVHPRSLRHARDAAGRLLDVARVEIEHRMVGSRTYPRDVRRDLRDAVLPPVDVVRVEDRQTHARFYGCVGASGGTPVYCRSNFAICAKAGAATTPPKIAVRGSSTITSTTNRGFPTGTMPTKDATYLPVV